MVVHVLATRGTNVWGKRTDFYLTQDDFGSVYFAPWFGETTIRFSNRSLPELLASSYGDNGHTVYDILVELKAKFVEYRKEKGFGPTFDFIYLKQVIVSDGVADAFHFEGEYNNVVFNNVFSDTALDDDLYN